MICGNCFALTSQKSKGLDFSIVTKPFGNKVWLINLTSSTLDPFQFFLFTTIERGIELRSFPFIEMIGNVIHK